MGKRVTSAADPAFYRVEPSKFLLGTDHTGSSPTTSIRPSRVAQAALAQWNAFLRTGNPGYRGQFLAYVSRLTRSEVRTRNGLSVWPTSAAGAETHACDRYLSAGIQGTVGSTLLRAHLLLGDEAYLQAARRALTALETEILDGGVASVVGADGLFFEDVAMYPAAHILSGFMLGLVSLHDYFELSGDTDVLDVIEQSTSTWHILARLYDTGYWSRRDLLDNRLATSEEHAFHVTLLRALDSYSGCDHCAKLADRWAGYQKRRSCRVRRALAERAALGRGALARTARRLMFPPNDRARLADSRDLVCIATPAFPVVGGTRAIVTAIGKLMGNEWDLRYLTYQIGPNPDGLPIERFGGRMSSYWQFPNVWFHAWAGLRKLTYLIRHGNKFRLILPQDGSYTAFFSAIVGKASGARVVSLEHGTLLFPYSRVYRAERVAGLRRVARLRLALLWPSLHLMSRVAVRLTDQFLVQGDEIEGIYRQHLGVHPSRIVRFLPAIDTEFFKPLSPAAKEDERTRLGFTVEDLVIVMNGRLAPEKGLDIALVGVAEALKALPVEVRGRVRLIIAGDGPTRSKVESIMRSNQLDSISQLWGEADPRTVAMLLSIGDVFLYTSVRGANTAVSVLEAMAAGCAVVASERPQSHAKLLADARGISIPPGDVAAVRSALSLVLLDSIIRADMGRSARDYIVRNYSPLALRRALLRATYYSPMGNYGVKS